VSNLKPEAKRDQILIISHSCTLKYMVCQEFDEKGKAKCKVSFKHCCPRLCTSDLLFQHEPKLWMMSVIWYYFIQLNMLSSRISQVFRFSNFRQHGLTLLNHSEKLAYVKMLEDNVDFEYKQYPLLPHQNSLSPEYI